MPLLAALLGFVALQGGWKPYTLGPGLRVDLPKPPALQPHDPEDPTAKTWLSMHQDRNVIVVSFAKFADASLPPPDEVLRNAVMGGIHATQGKLTGQRDILLNGWPGVEYRLKTPEGMIGVCRSYALKDGLASAFIASLEPKALDAPATKVFASFRLPASAGQGPFKVAGPEFKPYPVGDTGITVDLPKPPKIEDQDIPGPHKRKVYRYTAAYMNRAYTVGHIDLEEDEVATLSPEDIDELLRESHANLAQGLKAKAVPLTAVKLAGRDTYRAIYSLANGASLARAECTFIGRRVFIAIALTPPPLIKSPEVEKFFASVKVE